MARLKSRDLLGKYRYEALKVLIKHDIPTLDNVHHQVCLRDNCPVGACQFPGGFKEGKDCGHVLSIKKLIEKILEVTNE